MCSPTPLSYRIFDLDEATWICHEGVTPTISPQAGPSDNSFVRILRRTVKPGSALCDYASWALRDGQA